MNENLFDMFVGNIMFAGRNASSLDSLTSGRVSIVSEFPALIEGHWLTGIGSLYFECSLYHVYYNLALLQEAL